MAQRYDRYEQDVALPARLAELKRALAPKDGEAHARLVAAWGDLLGQLATAAAEIKEQGSAIVPQAEFKDLPTLGKEQLDLIKRRGCVLVRGVVDVEEATRWRQELEEYVKVNPVEGIPADNKQFFMLYWTRPQVQARAHPNVLATSTWLNRLYHVNDNGGERAGGLEGVDLAKPLSYADRFRIRHPGGQWTEHPPHIDGGGIERWEDPAFRSCFGSILQGDWTKHDPYDLRGRLDAKTSLYGRPNQSSVFRTFQGWLALSETAPTQGTLKVFPDVLLSNAYVMLRPFFRLREERVSEYELDPENWEYDDSTPDFPGIFALPSGGFRGPRLTPASHPHLRLEETMTPVPSVRPGDMVFWHCDVVHSVEVEHTGKEDSCVMYIPAVPSTPANLAYLERQKASFESGLPPPDFPKGPGEGGFVGVGKETDVVGATPRAAMGLVY